MKSCFKLIFLPLIILMFCGSFSTAQTKSRYSLGEIVLANNETKKGLVWLYESIDDEKTLYYKKSQRSVPETYYPNDILSFTFNKGEKKYVSETIIQDFTHVRQFLQLHINGEYDLLSFQTARSKTFVIYGPSGERYDLRNSAIFTEGESEVIYEREYINQLKEIFGSELKLQSYLSNPEYTTESLVDILKRYHKLNDLEYTLHPSPAVTNFFIGGGLSASGIYHISNLDPEINTVSPSGGASLHAGVKMLNNNLDLSFGATFIYGIIYHDDKVDKGTLLTYYDEKIETTILSLALNADFKLGTYGKFSPYIGTGISYSSFISYSRGFTEEVLSKTLGIVFSSYTEPEETPEGYPGLSIGLGTSIEINRTNSLRFELRYNKYYGNESGCQSLVGLNVGYQVNLF